MDDYTFSVCFQLRNPFEIPADRYRNYTQNPTFLQGNLLRSFHVTTAFSFNPKVTLLRSFACFVGRPICRALGIVPERWNLRIDRQQGDDLPLSEVLEVDLNNSLFDRGGSQFLSRPSAADLKKPHIQVKLPIQRLCRTQMAILAYRSRNRLAQRSSDSNEVGSRKSQSESGVFGAIK
jgi:hypothetical protein